MQEFSWRIESSEKIESNEIN